MTVGDAARRTAAGGRRRWRPMAAGLVIALVWSSVATFAGPVAGAGAATPKVPVPTVQGPILPTSGISFLGSTTFPVSQVGYQESEFFLSGTATSYTSATPLTKNGRWHVTPQTTAPYTTRVVVYRPADAKKFNGTVVVEWLNVTGGIDAPAAWLTSHVQMIRDGTAYIGVDAQDGGINGEAGSFAAAEGINGLKQTDPTRYGALNHPGDSFSYSIFQQTGAAVRADGTTLLAGLKPKRVIALGESQSAFRLVTYIDALQPSSPGIYNAYFVYSRGGDGSDLSQPPQKTIITPDPTYIRTDLHVPVFLFETESDVLGLGYKVARQPATNEIREWEVAGTAHDDTYGLLYSRGDTGTGAADTQTFASMQAPPSKPIPGIVECQAPINAGAHTYELRAALSAVNRWVTTGHAPPQSPRLQVNPSNPSAYLTDKNGNARGGVRTPQVVVPVATLSGLGQPGSMELSDVGATTTTSISGAQLCGILGTTVPFSTSKLAALYPSHAAFVRKWDAAVAADVKQGYLLPADAKTLDTVAANSSVGG